MSNSLSFWRGCLVFLIVALAMGANPPAEYAPAIPRVWTDEAIATFELPLARPEFGPKHVSEEYYYALSERTIWRSYPIYHPDHEPEGYRERLAQLEPEVIFDESQLMTEQDWISAGAEVFRAPVAFDGPTVRAAHVLDPAWHDANDMPITREGIFPYARWVIREQGKLEVGNMSCAMCHTRVMPDGAVIEGAQGNFPLERMLARRIASGRVLPQVVRRFSHTLAGNPWDGGNEFETMPVEELAALRAAMPSGVMARQGTSFAAPARVPDLIGLRDRKYLDATGLVRHREIGDVMRYAASNVAMDVLARFGDFVPDTRNDDRPPPGEGRFPGAADRFTDAQLFALAKFVYALKPPPSPHPFDELAARGQQVFADEGCKACHTPPLYTNNKLIAAPGFDPPVNHYERYEVSRRRVGTDPALTMATRRGTGYYKVPSLRGLWYRGPLTHSGSVAALEDWFDPRRLDADYVPTGFAPPDRGRWPVRGHTFGLDLSVEDRRALIAFLKTL